MFALITAACESGGESPDDVRNPRDSAVAERDATVPRDASQGASDARVDARTPTKDDAQVVRDAQSERDAGGDASANGEADAGASCLPFVMPEAADCMPPEDGVLPMDLRCTGLYGDFDGRQVACEVLEYKPAHELWSDGAEKRRWVSLPKGKKVDVSDQNEFVFPEGTRFWKEFRVRGADGQMRMAETRLLEKAAGGWLRTSYVWSEDQRKAIQMDNAAGAPDLYGTGHTVPNRDQCAECHGGRNDTILGWDALLLGEGAEGLTREKLVELGLVEGAPMAATIPGNEVERAALAYLHTNCGISCHNENPLAKARDTGLFLRLEVNELASVQTTDAYKSINKRPAVNAKYEGLTNQDPEHWYDILPGDPSRSLMIARQTIRGTEAQMPRIGTNKVDETGVQLVTRWIESMTIEAGYPAPATE